MRAPPAGRAMSHRQPRHHSRARPGSKRVVFADDAPIDARREVALKAILDALPPAFRIPMRGQFETMVNAMNEQQLTQVISDIREGKEAAAAGDFERMIDLARHWASDEQIAAYMPMAQSMLQTGDG